MGRPFDTLFATLIHPRRNAARRGRSIFTPRRSSAGTLPVASAHLTLARPESLERRVVMDIGAGMSYSTAFGTPAAPGTLGIWIDDSDANNDGTIDQDAFIRRNSDNTISVANAASFSTASMIAVEGQKQASSPSAVKWSGVNAIEVYRTSGLTLGPLPPTSTISAGSGYINATNLTAVFAGGTFLSGPQVWNGTSFTPGTPTLTATLNVTSLALSGTQTSATVFTVGQTVNLVGGGGTGATARVTAVDGTGKITAISPTPAATGSGYTTMPTGIAGAAGLTITASGAINAVTILSGGFGYATQPQITFTGGGGTGAAFNGVLATPVVVGSFTVDSVANPLAVPLNVGVLNFGRGALSVSPANVTLTGIASSMTLGGNVAALPTNVAFNGIIDTTANPAATITANANGPISVNAAITTRSISLTTFAAAGGDITITGGGVTTRAGDFTAATSSGAISVGSPLTINGAVVAQTNDPSSPINFAAPVTASSIFAQAGNTLEASADLVATGSGGIQLQSDTAQVVLSANVTADSTSGAVIISSPDGLGVLDTIVPAVITGQSLSLTEGGAASADYTLSTNVSVFTAQNLASNITLVNARALTVGTGPVTTFGNTLTIQTASGDLTVSGPITAAASSAADLTLSAAGNVAITSGAVTAINRTIAVIAGGNVVAASLMNATGPNGLVDVQAGTGINLGSNVRANNLSARTTTGDVTAQSTGTAALTVLNATTGSGAVSLQSTGGNLVLAGAVSTGSGSISLRSTAANISVLNTATITSPGGSITIRTDARNIDINGTISTVPAGTVVLTAANQTGGVITNGTAATITTGTLNYTAANSSSLLSAPTVSYGNLAATLTKAGEGLTLTQAGTLNLLAVTTNNGPVDIGANGGLSVTGPVNAGSAGNVTLRSANGTIAGAGLVTGNVLNVVAGNDVTLATNVSGLAATVTGAGTLTITERNGLAIASANVTTTGGAVNIRAGATSAGALNGAGAINAGAGNITLTNANGTITLTSVNNQIVGNVLTIAARDSVAVNTSVQTLNASVSNAAATLTVNESTGLGIQNATSAGGQIAITSGLFGPSTITGTGPVNATSAGNVTLTNANGGITLTGVNQVTGNVLTIAARDSVAVNTSVQTLNASVTNTSATLTVNEANGLAIANATTTGGQIAITGGLTIPGTVTGTGPVNATSAGNVTLTNANGGIVLSGVAGQVTGNVLNVTASGSTALNTAVTTLIATITGPGSSLTVNETNGLSVSGGLATNNGAIVVNVAGGNLNVSGGISAGTGANVTLAVAAGDLNATGQISGNALSVTANSASTLNTAVAALVANITGAGSSLTVTEADNLTIGSGNVRTNNGQITINTSAGGSLTRTGAISAGTANVSLTLAGGTSGTGLVTANQVAVTAVGNATLNTTVNSVVANVTGAGNSLAIFQTGKDLVVPAGTVRTNNGALTLSADGANNLTVLGNVTAGNAAVVLTAGGAVNASTGQIAGNVLTVTANSTSSLNTAVTTLNANISGAGSTLTVTEANGLEIGSGNVRTNNGQITISTGGGGSLARTGGISAGTANVSLNLAGGTNGTGVVTGNALNLTAGSNASINTNVGSILANVTGPGQPLAIYQTGRDLVVSGGEVRTNNGPLTLDAASPLNLTLTGNVTAGTGAVTLNAPGGNVTATGRISGGILNVTAAATSSLNTAVATLVANITGAGSSLTVTEADNLAIGSGNVRTNNGVISITTAGGGVLTRTGAVSAGAANVTLNLAGGTTGAGVVSGSSLNLAANGISNLNTAVTSVVANVSSGGLTINDADGIVIGAGGVRTNNANIAITAQAGSLAGSGAIDAGTAAVVLTNTNGGIALTSSAGQVVGASVAVNATGTSAVNTNASLLSAAISGAGQGLTVTQARLLSLGNVTSNNGTLTLNVANGLNGTGLVSAGTGGFVVLNASNGAVTLTAANQVTASGLTINALNSTAVNTSVTTLVANITGNGSSLAVNEANGLTIGAGGIAANGGNVNVTLATGSLNGTGAISAGSANVTLSALAGAITPQGSVTGNVLTLRAFNSSTLSTNVTSLNANLTGPSESLTITEANGLSIGSGAIVTNNGGLSINVTSGGISGTGRIATGSGNVALRTLAGNVTLTASANQITANALTIAALNSTAVNTSIASLDASITGNGSLTVNEADSITVTKAGTANGAINLTTSTNSVVNITAINALGTNGNLTVVNGNLFIDAPGIRATRTVNLALAQSVTVLSGGITAQNVILPTGQNTVNFLVTSSGDAGSGSLRDVITRINAGGGKFDSTIVVSSPTVISLGSALPTMTQPMNVRGNGNLTLDGTLAGVATSGFTIASASTTPSRISGVTFQNFGAAGIDLIGARNITITNIVVTGSGIGFRASGNLSGSSVVNSTFTNNAVGALLSNAQNLTIGAVGSPNTFAGGTGGFRGPSTTGMSVSGNSTSTVVKANTFTGYPTAVSIVAATNFTFGGSGANEFNTISNATTAGIYATGFCTGSSVVKTQFGTGVAASKQYLVSTMRGLSITL